MTYEVFKELCKDIFNEDLIWIHEENMDIGGGRISYEDIDQLQNYVSIEKVKISGLRQDTFEYFMEKYGHKIKYLIFFKNKMVEDLSILSNFPNIEFIYFSNNQRIEKLWNMKNNINLKGICFENFTRLHSLEGIQTAPNLQHLSFGNSVWATSTLDNIEVLRKSKLQSFRFDGKKIENIDIKIFREMPCLKYLDFPTNMFSTEEIAELVAYAPNLTGYSLRPCVIFEKRDDDIKDVLIVGKRKPFLDSEKDKEKIERYIKQFNDLVEKYRKLEF